LKARGDGRRETRAGRESNVLKERRSPRVPTRCMVWGPVWK
jgi:hypothetical protein